MVGDRGAQAEVRRPARTLLRGAFGWFFAGRAVDLFGSSMTTVALALAVLAASGRPTDLGYVLAASMIPTLALTLFGGAVADRRDRRLVLVVANLVSGAAMAVLAGVLVSGHYSLTAAMACSAVSGAASAFTSPALRGIVPELVPLEQVQQANALLASVRNAVRIIAPAVAGVLVATCGGGWAVGVDAASYVVAALLLARIPASSTPPAGEGIRRDLVEGWTAFRSLPWVVALALSGAVLNAANVGPWNVLGPTLTSEQSGPAAWGLVLSTRAAGLLLASTMAVRATFRRPLRTGRLLGTLAALPLLTLGLGAPTWVTAAAAFVGALGFTVSGITWDTALQTHVPRDRLSRVSAYDDLLSYIAIPLSQVATAPLAARFGAHHLAVTVAALYAAASLAPLANRTVRTQT